MKMCIMKTGLIPWFIDLQNPGGRPGPLSYMEDVLEALWKQVSSTSNKLVVLILGSMVQRWRRNHTSTCTLLLV